MVHATLATSLKPESSKNVMCVIKVKNNPVGCGVTVVIYLEIEFVCMFIVFVF